MPHLIAGDVEGGDAGTGRKRRRKEDLDGGVAERFAKHPTVRIQGSGGMLRRIMNEGGDDGGRRRRPGDLATEKK